MAPFDQVEQGRAPYSVPRMAFEKIDEEVGVKTDAFTFGWKARRGLYHERRSRFR